MFLLRKYIVYVKITMFLGRHSMWPSFRVLLLTVDNGVLEGENIHGS